MRGAAGGAVVRNGLGYGTDTEWNTERMRNGFGMVWKEVRNGMAIVPTLGVVATLGYDFPSRTGRSDRWELP